jgi:hypothetical protein
MRSERPVNRNSHFPTCSAIIALFGAADLQASSAWYPVGKAFQGGFENLWEHLRANPDIDLPDQAEPHRRTKRAALVAALVSCLCGAVSR